MISTYEYAHIFLDFDGVIKDSNHVKGTIFCSICEADEHMKDRILEHHSRCPAMGRVEKIRTYLKWQDKDFGEEDIVVLVERFELEAREVVKSCPWIPGVLSFIKEESKDKELYVLTAMPQESIDFLVEDLGISKYFSEVIGSRDTKANILRRFNEEAITKNEKAIFFGDSVSDYEAALLASVDFCLVGSNIRVDECPYAIATIPDFSCLV